MKCFRLLFIIGLLFSCGKDHLHILKGYIIYNEPKTLFFLETIKDPSGDYYNLTNDDFKSGFLFHPNCFINDNFNDIKPDTLNDENPKLDSFPPFLKKIKIFPAELIICDTVAISRDEFEKFKFVLKGRDISFRYKPTASVISSLRRYFPTQ